MPDYSVSWLLVFLPVWQGARAARGRERGLPVAGSEGRERGLPVAGSESCPAFKLKRIWVGEG